MTSLHEDPRFCPSWLLLSSMHRLLLQCPVLGLPREFEAHCVPVRRSVLQQSSAPALPEDVFTWKAAGSRVVTIMKTGPTTTIVWDQGSGTSFKAQPCCSLGPGCPVGASFLGQVVMDRMAGEGNSKDSIQDWRVNVLVFDVLCFGNQNFLTQPAPAAARYALLRDLEDDFSKGVFVSQSMKVQWAGKLDALRQFSKSEGSKLPHIIDCFVRLGSTNPGELAFLQRA